MQNIDLMATGIFITAIGGLTYALRQVPALVWKMIKRKITFTVTIEQGSDFFTVLSDWFNDNEKENFSNISVTLHKDDLGKWTTKFNHYSDAFISRQGGKKILISKSNRDRPAGNANREEFILPTVGVYEITGLFAKKQILQFIQLVVDYDNNKPTGGKIKVKSDRWDGWNLSNTIVPKPINHIFIDGVDKLVEDIDRFVAREDWYMSKGIPYKRGYFFSGTAGNGKSSLIQAIARHLNRDIFMLSLKDTSSDRDLISKVSSITPNSILVLEDIDTVGDMVKERKETGEERPAPQSDRVSLSALLNCLDGAFYRHGLIVIATSNFREKLDPALLRNGRFDYKMNINNPSKEKVQQFLTWFYDQQIALDDRYVDGSFPMVQIQELACQHTPTECVKALALMSHPKHQISETQITAV